MLATFLLAVSTTEAGNIRMLNIKKGFILFALLLSGSSLSFPTTEAAKKRSQWRIEKAEIAGEGPAVLWREPTDIRSRNLFYGAGGKEHEPHGPFTFVKEDLDGSSPKFTVEDQDGKKWKVKLGAEARPETAATRFVWAVGYFTNEDYFLPLIKIDKVPEQLHRGRKLIASDGAVRNVRLKRNLPNVEKLGNWEWSDTPFKGTRELDGLRVMMAIINNWDLKDVNNAIYQEKHGASGPEQVYMVSDLGAAFAGTAFGWPREKSRGNLQAYRHSKFITDTTPAYVDFATPARPKLMYFFFGPGAYTHRVHLGWIGKHIPRENAAWMGQLLAQLSREQIQDAFRSAGYEPEQVDGFSTVFEHRIGELKSL
jgi:hypothetical protein